MKKRIILRILPIAFLIFMTQTTKAQDSLQYRYSEYEPNYIISNFGKHDFGQLKFKISFKYNLFFKSNNGNKVFFAYTQFAFWDVYQPSAPMRELVYTPMLFYEYKLHPSSLSKIKFENVKFGTLHQSNGKDGESNRSIFKGFVHSRISYRNNSNSTSFRLKEINMNPQVWFWYLVTRENETIADYQGYGQLITNFNFDYGQSNGKTPIQLSNVLIPAKRGTSFVINLMVNPFKKTEKVPWVPNLYLQYWNGYGESLLNYDNRFNNYTRQSVFRAGIQFRID